MADQEDPSAPASTPDATEEPEKGRASGSSGLPRPSLPPSGRSLPPPSSIGPGKNYRILFAALWIGLQITLVFTADRRLDGAFGFRMFSESSSIKVTLLRELGPSAWGGTGAPSLVHVEGGVWSARGADGIRRRFSWYDRVPTPYWLFDQDMHASYGAATQLSRLQGALDDVAAHVPEDGETRRFILEVVVRRNGHEPVTHRLTSRERRLSTVIDPVDVGARDAGGDAAPGGP